MVKVRLGGGGGVGIMCGKEEEKEDACTFWCEDHLRHGKPAAVDEEEEAKNDSGGEEEVSRVLHSPPLIVRIIVGLLTSYSDKLDFAPFLTLVLSIPS